MSICSIGRLEFVTVYPEPRLAAALMVKFLLDYFTRLCRNMALKPT